MLGKLIKHDFRALSRLLVPTIIAILGATLLASLGISMNIRMGYSSFSEGPMSQIIVTLSIFLSVIMIVGICAAFLFIMFVVFQRFYKNLMTSEGYLTFTLPVKTSDILWSKLISAMIWMFVSSLVAILCGLIFALFGTSGEGIINTDVLHFMGDAMRALSEVYTGGITVIIIELILLVIVSSVSSIMQIYLALIIGGAVAGKHKLLAGIGFYFAINMAMGAVSSIVQVPIMASLSQTLTNSVYDGSSSFVAYSAQDSINYFVSFFQPYYWIVIGMALVYSVAFFIISHYFLKNKLNLQ